MPGLINKTIFNRPSPRAGAGFCVCGGISMRSTLGRPARRAWFDRFTAFVQVAVVLGVTGLLAPVATLAQDSQAPPQAPAATFDILEYRVLGNSVLDVRAIEAAVYPHLGSDKTFKDVENARAALEAAYHDHGFGTVFVDIPEQSVDDGIVRLRATEGRLHASTIKGAQYFSERQIKAAVPAAAAGTVPHLPVLQQQLTAVNAASPDRSVVPVLKAGPEPGTVDLALNVEDHLPFHGSVQLDNQYTADTKPLRLTGYASYDNLFGSLHSLSVQYQAAPQRTGDAGVVAVGYVAPVSGGKLAATYIHNSSDVTTIGGTGVIGKGSIYGVHYDYVIAATPRLLEDLTVALSYKSFVQNTAAPPSSSGAPSPAVESPIKYADVTVTYAGTLNTDPRGFTWSIGPSFSLRGVGSNATDFSNKCYECRQDYFLLRADGSVTEHLAHGFDIGARAAGQYAVTPLVNNEQFLVGGAQTVRGYYEAEGLGDRGIRGSLELRAPNVLPAKDWARLSPYVFADAGDIAFVAPLPAQPTSLFLASAGAGFNLVLGDHVQGNLVYAHALDTHHVTTTPAAGSTPAVTPTHTQAGDSRWLFVIKGVW